MSDALVTIATEGGRSVYRAGDVLSGHFVLDDSPGEDIEAVEMSVIWYTEGKGDEDLAVHLFQRFNLQEDASFDPREPVHFSTQLPTSPLSYEGVVLKIRWCVRVRVFLKGGKEIVEAFDFRLGSVPAAEAVAS